MRILLAYEFGSVHADVIRWAKRDQIRDSGQKCDSIVHDVNDSSS